MTEKEKTEALDLKRRNQQPVVEPDEIPPVSAGAVEKALDLAFNPTREKIREVTIIDRMQGRLLPQLDVVNTSVEYVLKIAFYRKARQLFLKGLTKRRIAIDGKEAEPQEEYKVRLDEFMKGFTIEKPEPPNLGDEII